MNEYGFSETSDDYKLEERPESDNDAQKCVPRKGSFSDGSRQEASNSGYDKPAKQDQ